jgi:hypothetical protein
MRSVLFFGEGKHFFRAVGTDGEGRQRILCFYWHLLHILRMAFAVTLLERSVSSALPTDLSPFSSRLDV